MVQRTKREGSQGSLASRRGTLALGLILGFTLGNGLVLKVPYGVRTPYTESFTMIDHVSSAAPLNLASGWTGHGSAELANNRRIALDSPMRISWARLTPSTSEGRKDKQQD